MGSMDFLNKLAALEERVRQLETEIAMLKAKKTLELPKK